MQGEEFFSVEERSLQTLVLELSAIPDMSAPFNFL